MQNRIGPNRAGPFGLLQTLADGINCSSKRTCSRRRPDRFVFRLAPYLALLPALLIFTIVPVGGVVTIAHHTFELQVADPPHRHPAAARLLVGVGFTARCLAGWASGSKYPLLGSIRASAQMISYEAAMGLTIATVVVVTHSLSTRAIVDAQAVSFFHWNILPARDPALPALPRCRDGRAQPSPFDLSRASRSSWAGSTPSTRRYVSHCSTWPSS